MDLHSSDNAMQFSCRQGVGEASSEETGCEKIGQGLVDFSARCEEGGGKWRELQHVMSGYLVQ